MTRSVRRLPRSFTLVFVVAAVLLAAGSGAGKAQTTIAVSYFPGPSIAPVFVGIERGIFAKAGLTVHPQSTDGSIAQIGAMLADTCQIAFGGLDDVIAYDVGEGEVPMAQNSDLFAFMGTDSGSLHLVTAPEVKTVEALRGRTLAVDAKTTGFAFVLYRIAALHGLKPGAYDVLSVGSSQKRLEALSQGQAQAAVMFKPVADMLAAKGFNDLVTVSDILPHYQAAVALARRGWAKPHRAALVAFIRGYIDATRWFLEPANKNDAIGMVLKNSPNPSRPSAEAIYAVSLAAGSKAAAIGGIDRDGVATAVQLRETYGVPKKTLGDPRQFYDLSYYRAALKGDANGTR